jgi:hypothetical protein
MNPTSNSNVCRLAAAFGCCSILIVPGAAVAQTSLRPAAILHVSVPEEVNAQPNAVMALPETLEIPFRSTLGPSALIAAKQRAETAYAPGYTKPLPLVPLAPPVIKIINFNGHPSTDGSRPPDTHGAVGLTHFVEVTNSHFDVYTRVSPVSLVKSVTLATFFNYTARSLFDPRVVYDSTWNRWVVTAEAFPESTAVQRFFIAVSQTSNPTGLFYVYNIDVDFFNNNDFWDFPQLGMDQDSILITANIFSAADEFVGADFFAVAKARLYNGLGFSAPVFTGLAGTLAPPIVLDQNSSTFLIAARPSGSALSKYTVTNSSRNPGIAVSAAASIPVASYAVPPDAHQFGTTDRLDTSDSRFLNASTQVGTDLWQTHTIALGNFPAPRFYRINPFANTVKQSGFYFASGSSDDFNASITANAAGNCFVTYTSTNASASTNAQVRLSGKLSADTSIGAGPLGFTSPTFYNPSGDIPERWGDYSAVTLDPSSSADAWLVNEKINGNALWGSRVIKFGF